MHPLATALWWIPFVVDCEPCRPVIAGDDEPARLDSFKGW
jgi:hypothetical protein